MTHSFNACNFSRHGWIYLTQNTLFSGHFAFLTSPIYYEWMIFPSRSPEVAIELQEANAEVPSNRIIGGWTHQDDPEVSERKQSGASSYRP